MWGFLPTIHLCLSPKPLLDPVTRLAFSAWNLALLTAVAILGVLGTALDTGGSLTPLPTSVLLLTSRQHYSGSLETWTRVLEVIWRPQVCRGREKGRPREKRGLVMGLAIFAPIMTPPGTSSTCCSVLPIAPWVVGMAKGQKLWAIRRPFPTPKLQVSHFCLLACLPQHHICHHSVLQEHHGSRRRCWRGGLRGQFLGGKQLRTGF